MNNKNVYATRALFILIKCPIIASVCVWQTETASFVWVICVFPHMDVLLNEIASHMNITYTQRASVHKRPGTGRPGLTDAIMQQVAAQNTLDTALYQSVVANVTDGVIVPPLHGQALPADSICFSTVP